MPRLSSTRQQGVVGELREKIMSGSLNPGDRLLEIPLSEELQVSRTPIREALIALAEEGLIDYRPNRGYVVRTFTIDYIMQAFMVREALEGLACRLAAERGVNKAHLREMDDCLREGDRLLSGPKLQSAAREPWREVNDRLHRLIIDAANNEPLEQALAVTTRLPYASSRVVHWFDDDDMDGLFQLRMVHSQHHDIVRAIADRAGYRAETVMRGHIAYAAGHVRQQLTENPADAD